MAKKARDIFKDIDWKPPVIENRKLTEWNWTVQNPEGLKLGYKTDIGAFSFISAKYGVVMEDYVAIGSHCSIYSDAKNNLIDITHAPVVLKKNCTIGTHSSVMPGVTVGRNSIIGAYSFVKSDIPDNSLAYGVPAKVIRKLTSKEIKKLESKME
jgi:acetyltransferase-like isoleucine patch superfamily enzyme